MRFAIPLTAIAAILVFGASAPAAVVVNGDFESGSMASGNITPSADAGAGWSAGNLFSIVSGGQIDGTREAYATDSGDTEGGIGQIVADNAATTGSMALEFDYHLVWNDRVANDGQDTIGFLYYVLGTDDASAVLDLGSDNPNDGNWTEVLSGQASETFADDGTGQTASGSVSAPLSLPGHTYLAVAIRWEKSTFGTNWSGIKTGTGARVDNVALVPEPATGLLALVGLLAPALRRRRR
jgi:MYXO-CTERM domain-containing protein